MLVLSRDRKASNISIEDRHAENHLVRADLELDSLSGLENFE